MAEIHKSGLPKQHLDIEQILQEAKSRWLRPTEICEILSNYKHFRIAPEPPDRPPSGSLFLFDRKILRYFRKDGHNWGKKRDRKTVMEAHERLKVGSREVLHAYYAHGEENSNFQRRTYWLLEEGLMNIVLVHYLEVRGGKQSFSRAKEAEEISGLSNVDNPACSISFASKSEVVSPNMEAGSPISGQFSEYEDTETGGVFNEAGARLRSGSNTMLDSRWISKELTEFVDLDMNSSESANVAVGEQLDAYVVGPSLAQYPYLCIIEVSPSWAYTCSKTKVVITGTFLINKEDVENFKWSCMFGDVEVLAEVLADGSLRCYTPVHRSGRVPFYVTCSNRLACSDVREFEFRDSETHLRIRLQKLLLLRPDDPEKYILSGGDEKSELINTINLLMLDDKLSNLPLPSDKKEFSYEKLVKEQLHYWLIQKIHDGKGPNMVGKEGQGVIHLVAALGYDWAIRPIIAAGVHVNFRDAYGWTALHWAASCGRERTVGTLIANEAACGALTDPTPQFPSGRTPADLASENGHKGIAGFLAESSLTTHLLELTLKGSKGDNLKEIYKLADADEFAESISTQLASQDSQAESLKDPHSAVSKSAQAAGRIFQASRVDSFDSKNGIEFVSLKNARPGQNDMLHSAAARIQKRFRGWKGKKEFMNIRQKSSRYRGHQVRRSYRKIVWSVSIVEKVILRRRRKGRGLRGFQPEKQLKASLPQIRPARGEDEYDFLKAGKKQAEDRLQRALARVKSMAQYPDGREQYIRLRDTEEESKVRLPFSPKNMI